MRIVTFLGIVLVAAMASATSALGAGVPQTDFQEVITVTPDFDTPVFYEEKLIIPTVLRCPGKSLQCYPWMVIAQHIAGDDGDEDEKNDKTVLV